MAEKKTKPKKTPAEKPAPKPAKKVLADPAGPAARLKPKLTPEQFRALRLRRRLSDKRPRFLRTEWFRHPRLQMIWRKPQGDHNKIRTYLGYRINSPSIGFRGPALVRGLHPSGFSEVLVHNLKEVEGLNPALQAVRIASGVGLKKRAVILAAADEKGLRVLNRGWSG